VLVALGVGADPPAAGETLSGPELVRALQQGGFVIYLRHGATQRDQQDAERIDLERCETQRNLSYERSDTLSYSLRLSAEERRRAGAGLRELLGLMPAPGTNTVLVAHNSNLKDATGLWPKDEGDAHVFRPRGRDGFDHVAEVPAAQWSQWARAMGTPR
jgi:hypothetical protein